LRPSEVEQNGEAALARIRQGPSLTPSSLYLDFGGARGPELTRRFEAMCRLAKGLTVAVLTMPAASLGTPMEEEVRRLSSLAEISMREGLVLTVLTHGDTVTADPAAAAALCQAVPGLGLTLDPSHYLNGTHAGAGFDELYPYVQNVHFRDTSRKEGEFQVRVGQGQVEYGKIINILERHGYMRGLNIAIFDQFDNPFEVEVEVRKLKLLLESLI
jgi:sugar phosphate isomerase/epimerase